MENENIENENKCSSLGWAVRILGVAGLGYLAYKKKDRIKEGYFSAKDKMVELAEPTKQGLKDSAEKVQDFIQEKTSDAVFAVVDFSQKIEDRYNKLKRESRKKYLAALKDLHDKISMLEKKAEK